MEHFGEGRSKEKEAAYKKKITMTETSPLILILIRSIGNNYKCQKKKKTAQKKPELLLKLRAAKGSRHPRRNPCEGAVLSASLHR